MSVVYFSTDIDDFFTFKKEKAKIKLLWFWKGSTVSFSEVSKSAEKNIKTHYLDIPLPARPFDDMRLLTSILISVKIQNRRWTMGTCNKDSVKISFIST